MIEYYYYELELFANAQDEPRWNVYGHQIVNRINEGSSSMMDRVIL